jgi:hypothetical protein
MTLPWRIVLFVAPIVLAAICKVTIASAAGGAEFAIYQSEPARLVDWSVDLLLTGTAILLGVLLYVHSGTVTTTPGGVAVSPKDLVICGGVQIAAVILIFGSTIGLPHVPLIHQYFEQIATIWLPNMIGLVAFLWVIVKLT